MDTKIQFQKNAAVLAANGDQVGSLNRLVVDPNHMVLTDIVVRTGALFNQEERVVPIALVAESIEDQIVLSDEVQDLQDYPPFEEEHMVGNNENMQGPLTVDGKQSLLYGMPIGIPLVATVDEKRVTQVDQNIPDGMIAMKEGAAVISADRKHLGKVERAFTDASYERITHLLISLGTFTSKRKLIPVEWVQDVNENEVTLQVFKTSVDALADSPMIK